MRLMPLPLAFVIATCAPIGAEEPPPVSVRSPSEMRAAEPGTVTLRLPCTEATEADDRLAEAGYVLVAAGVAAQVVVRLYLGGRDAFALVGFDGQGRACLLANGEGWTGIRRGAGLHALVPFLERMSELAGLPAEALAKAGVAP